MVARRAPRQPVPSQCGALQAAHWARWACEMQSYMQGNRPIAEPLMENSATLNQQAVTVKVGKSLAVPVRSRKVPALGVRALGHPGLLRSLPPEQKRCRLRARHLGSHPR